MPRYDRYNPYNTRCYTCGAPCSVPFHPRRGQLIYCPSCYAKIKKERAERRSRRRTSMADINHDIIPSAIGFIIIILVIVVLVLALGKMNNSDSQNPIDDLIKSIDESINPPIYQETIWSSLPDGSTATVTIYRNATDPTYEQLISFLAQDDTVYADYIPDQYVCINFAIHLADNAEKKEIKAHIVSVDFEDLSDDHALTAFNTTDRGWIYVDATGYKREDKATGAKPIIGVVNMIVGGQYIRNPIISQSGTEPSMGCIKAFEILN